MNSLLKRAARWVLKDEAPEVPAATPRAMSAPRTPVAPERPCPRCNRELDDLGACDGSPLCRRCTTKLTVPLALGLDRDGLIRERNVLATAVALGGLAPAEAEMARVALARVVAALADVDARIAQAIQDGLPALNAEWSGR